MTGEFQFENKDNSQSIVFIVIFCLSRAFDNDFIGAAILLTNKWTICVRST